MKPRKDCKRAANASRHTPNRDSGQTWSQKGHLSQGHKIIRVCVKLINSSVLKVSSWLAPFYASYLRNLIFSSQLSEVTHNAAFPRHMEDDISARPLGACPFDLSPRQPPNCQHTLAHAPPLPTTSSTRDSEVAAVRN